MMRAKPWTIAALLVAATATADAQSTRYADRPTEGLYLPATPLAGDQDARATVRNPAGLQFLDGRSLVLAIDAADPDAAVTSGTGVGGYAATVIGGTFIPRIALGAGVEALRPPRVVLDPDPGTPWRLTLSASFAPRPGWGLGVAWHHLGVDGPARGTDTFDVGLATRLGNHLAAGAVVRDVNAPRAGTVELERRYELELVARPLGNDRIELGVGGRIGEADGDADGWLRASGRVARGVFVEAVGETRALTALETTGSGVHARDERDLRATLGVSISFGEVGVALYGSGRLDGDGEAHPLGGTVVARWSEKPVPAVQGHGARIERLEFTGGVSARDVTAAVLRLRAIARDPDVIGVVLAIDGANAGWASLDELRREVQRVRARGKKVFAYLVAASARDYWLASAADKIYLDPGGGVRLIGFAGTTIYFRGLFDQLGVSAQFEKIAEYKSAPEQYTETAATPIARQMRDELYDSLYQSFVAGIAEGRRLDPAVVQGLIDGGPYSAGQLDKDHRLVDAVGEPERVAQLIAVELGGLAPVTEAPVEKDDRWQRPTIAVIYADGDIVDGKSMTIPFLGRKLVGGETIAGLIAAARESPLVDAIVIRIDSPGGSALASELMSREVFKTRGVKPIVCSMGDLAASGGYYLAAGCDTIFASPTTITGSIGIFYGKFDLSGLLAKLGVTSETFKRGARSDMESMFRPYTDEERVVLLDRLRYFYGRFTDAVSRGRGLTVAQVDAIGRGHVWSGVQAKGIGLVDELGGVGDAIELAKRRVGLAPDAKVRILSLPRESAGLLGLLGSLTGAQATTPSLADLPGVRAALDAVPPSLLVTPQGAQARLPFDISWE